VSVLLPSGDYIINRYATTEDSFGMPARASDTPQTTVTVAGRVRTAAGGVQIALDPAAWPVVSVPDGRTDIFVTIIGPDTDGATRTWVIQSSSLRKGLDSDLDELSYIEASAIRYE
jgi:hypothetical protein